MTVVVQCFHCNAILELDEGFRGGVCRCSNCGSLLQVPKADGPAPKGKKVRPAMPPSARSTAPAAAGQGAAAQATAKDDSGAPHSLPQSPFDPRRPSFDAGGSSSGLGRIHKTQPGDAAAPKSRHARETSHASTLPAARGLPQLRAIRHNKRLFWSGVMLILILAATIITLLAIYIYHPGA